MKIKALRDYTDLQKNKAIKKDEEYIVTLERGHQIIAKGYAVEVKEQPKIKDEPKANTVKIKKIEPKKKPSFNVKDKMKK